MTVEEIFSKLSSHMVKGLMTHSDYADYYYFLNLCGYGDTHNKHYVMESNAHRELNKWYILHYNKLIPQERIDYESVIPESWYNYKRFDVDRNTLKKSVELGLTTWVEWERDTKKFYEQMFKELMGLDEISAAMYVKRLIDDVSEELCHAENYLLQKRAVDFNISDMIAEQ